MRGLGFRLESGDEERQEAEDEFLLADFEAFGRRRPAVDFATQTDMVDSLRNRRIDCS